ncbi:leishmanolysin-like peptidase [Lucilia cuprina]|uniref:leishmanolysin-like peptidase n=1 Tax=Lucilia cuprina TaxID=7375 RepID=UPI001F05F70D|nr:leishmanolysin-like peptidase [Lucilia cuprina]
MCQQLYLPHQKQQQQVTENTTPPPNATLGQIKQVLFCRSNQDQHYYNNLSRHQQHHHVQMLHKSREFISSNDQQHYHRNHLLLRIFLLRNNSNMIVPFRQTYHLSFMLLSTSVLLLLLNSIHVVQSHNCQHLHPKAHEVIHGVRIETVETTATSFDHAPQQLENSLNHDHQQHHSRRKKRSTVERPLRISLVYDESVLGLDTDKFILINDTVLPEAIQFWEQALMVRQTKGPIRLNRKCNSTKVFVKNGLTHCIDNCKSITMCGEVEVPEEHLDVCRICNATGQNCRVEESTQAGEGIEEADFVFYVSARQTERCHKGLTVAYAAHCQQEATLDRPIAGHANLCPNSISTKPQELQTLISTVKHEILHALGFSVSLFAFFRDDEGKPRTPRIPDTGKPHLNEILQIHQWSNDTIRKVVRDNWSVRNGHVRKEIDMMVTPRVVQEVRKHFNCDLLEGAELEDQGGEGTALTHWEKRILENEAMTGTHTQSPVFSRITLALMEDSGWYRANYSMASPLSWGRGLGCNFVMRSCKDWIQLNNAKGRSIHPFCSKVKQDPLQTECTDDRNSVALCNLIRHEYRLPEQYQNFDSINNIKDGDEVFYGGSVSLADHCPYIQEFTWRNNNITIRGSHCHFVENNPKPSKNYALESYGQGSKCFDHGDAMWEERTCHHTREWQHWGSGCYKYNCSDGRLHIQVANYTYTCYFPGQRLSISISANGWLHRGALICPSCEELCGEYFGARDEQCRLREEAPPLNKYPQDHLRCGAQSVQVTLAQYLPLTLAVLSLLFHKGIVNAIRQR